MQVGALILRLHITNQGAGRAGEVEGTDNFQYDFEQKNDINTKTRRLLKRKRFGLLRVWTNHEINNAGIQRTE